MSSKRAHWHVRLEKIDAIKFLRSHSIMLDSFYEPIIFSLSGSSMMLQADITTRKPLLSELFLLAEFHPATTVWYYMLHTKKQYFFKKFVYYITLVDDTIVRKISSWLHKILTNISLPFKCDSNNKPNREITCTVSYDIYHFTWCII